MAEDDKDAEKWAAVEDAAELLAEEKFQDALYALRDVVKADPLNPYAFQLMGSALYEVGQLEPARDAYRAALRVSPSFLGARTALAGVLRALHDHRGALREAQEALRQAPADPDALHTMGMSYAALGARTEAARYLLAFLETKPELEVAMEVRQILEMLKLSSGPFELNLLKARLFAQAATGTLGLYKGVQLLADRRPPGRKGGLSGGGDRLSEGWSPRCARRRGARCRARRA